MSLDRNVSDAMDREVGGTINRMESNRQDLWSSQREDRDSLHDSITEQVDAQDNPEPIPDWEDKSDFDRWNPTSSVRDAAEAAYKSTSLAADEREQDEKEMAEYREIGRNIKRQFGIPGPEGFRRLVSTEERMRNAPYEQKAADFQQFYNTYFESDYAQQIAATAVMNVDQEAVAVCKKYGIDKDDPGMLRVMRTDEFQRSKTGNTESDILRAYRKSREGHKRVKMPGGW